MLQTLRRVGGSLVMTMPKAFVDQNSLSDGSRVELHVAGSKITIEASARIRPKKQYKLADLIAEMPDGLPRLEVWDDLNPLRLERG